MQSLNYVHESGVDRPIRIAAPMLSRMANFDDADPLRLEPGVQFDFIPPGQSIPRDCDLVILFGSKSTVGDLQFLREQGWEHDIIAHARSGGRVLGICGGYQMLGREIVDAAGNDGLSGQVAGLGLLDVVTRMGSDKTVQARRRHLCRFRRTRSWLRDSCRRDDRFRSGQAGVPGGRKRRRREKCRRPSCRYLCARLDAEQRVPARLPGKLRTSNVRL